MIDNSNNVPALKFKERLSYSLTNTGQTMIYAIITNYLLMYMTDYLIVGSSIAGIIIGATRIFDAINDPLMGAILDRTHSRWGKCRPYMLFTPIPVAIFTILMFAPFGFTIVPEGSVAKIGSVIYITVIYVIFTMIYTANDIPYWSMSSVITTDPKQRVKVVTLTRTIGGLGSALAVGTFWIINDIASKAGANERWSFFIAVIVFCILGSTLMLQGFFNTRERAKNTAGQDKFFDNLKLVPKSKPLMINLIAGMLVSVMAVGTTAMTTYFIKWNLKDVFSGLSSNEVMGYFTPIIGILPAIATFAGILAVPKLIKLFEKRDLLIVGCILGIIANIVSYFIGYSNIYIFIAFRFIAFLPMGVWSGVTTLMIGDSVDQIEYTTGKRVEGTCFSLLTFIGKFQNGINVAITGFLLTAFAYDGNIKPNLAQQAPETLKGIFIMVTLVSALGFLLMAIPFLFYDFTTVKHQAILEEIKARDNEVIS